MVVQHNLRAMNSNRMLGITQGTLSKSTEKLSSGYKVNRAADDAAGLSISEKMRKQIRGLTQASTNAEDGISAVQTAEGALTEVHDMLQRMNELAVKAANGTNSVSDRQTIQDEISQLTTEIDRVAETTKFNETYLLKGDGTTSIKTLEAHDAGLAGTLEATATRGKATFTADDMKVGDVVKIGNTEYSIVDSARTDGYTSLGDWTFQKDEKITQDGKTYTVSVAGKAGSSTLKLVDENGNDVKITIREGATLTTTLAKGAVSTVLVGKEGLSLVKYGTELNKTNMIQTPTATSIRAGSLVYDYTPLTGGQTRSVASVTGIYVALVNTSSINTTPGSNPATSTKDATGLIKHTWVAGDKVISEDGTEYTYVEAGKSLNGVKHDKAGFYKTENSTSNDKAYQMQAGDNYIIKENLKNGVDLTYTGKASNGGIATVQTIQDAVRATSSGASITIKEFVDDKNGRTYNVGVTNKQDGKVFTADDIAALIKEGNYVTITPAGSTTGVDYYAVPSTSEKKEEITIKQAYEMMAKELEQASSIGADEDTKASVKHVGQGVFEITQGKVEITNALNFALHVGADADLTNKIGVNIKTMSTAGLGIKGLNILDDTGNAATYAVDAIADAVATVSAQRSLLGAVQNRLEHTINNLDNVVENTTAAESQIRDTDMATEMVKFANNNILSQAGQSMLAQSNQANQGVLSLLG